MTADFLATIIPNAALNTGRCRGACPELAEGFVPFF